MHVFASRPTASTSLRMDAASLDAMMPWRPGIAPDEAATTNDGEEPATKSGAPKKKRQRLVHPNHDSFGACDTCKPSHHIVPP